MAEKLIYREPEPITEEELTLQMASGDPERQYAALVRASLSTPESEVLIEHLHKQLRENDFPLIEGALTSCSHVARLVGFERPRGITALIKPLTKDPLVGDHARSILWDVQHFCGMGLRRRLKRCFQRRG